MFANLYTELKKAHITQIRVSKELGITDRSFSKKIHGNTDFTCEEMFAIQQKFFPDKTLEYLFARY
jgi:hypothetical protein|nr:MAG TPA: Regulatory protein-modification, helix-turn-helix, transcriptional regulator, DNA [Caudoviricetes sp.]